MTEREYVAGDPQFNLTGGPTGATPATLAALGRPILHHLDPAFGAIYQDTVELLGRAFGTSVAPVILHGEAVLGLEAAAASLIGPADVVLNLVSGMFGRGYGTGRGGMRARSSRSRSPSTAPSPRPASPRPWAGRPDITVVSVVHCETPCGTVNDLDAIAAVVAEHGALLIVDAVSSFGGIGCDVTAWGDCLVVTAPQKCLGGPPGLSLLHVSDAAWARMAANPAAPRGSALSILDSRGRPPGQRALPVHPVGQ